MFTSLYIQLPKNAIPLLVFILFMIPLNDSKAFKHESPPVRFHLSTSVREVTGYVTGKGSVLSNVVVMVKDTDRQSLTDEKGYYKIRAAPGEVIVYSYMGLKNMEVIVEDVTKKLNINLVSELRMLSEVKLGSSGNSVDIPNEIDSYFGKMDRRKMGFSSFYVEGEDLNLAGIDLVDALRGKVPGYQVMDNSKGVKQVVLRDTRQAALWEIDGVLFEDGPPYVNLTNVQSVNVIKSPAGLARYGNLGRGGVIIVKTKDQVFSRSDQDKIVPESGTNKNYFKNDAVSINTQTYVKPRYWSSLQSAGSHQETLKAFEQFLPVYKDQASFYLDFATKISKQGFDQKSIRRVLDEMQDQLFYDPVGLKSLAYFYQQMGWDYDAVKANLRILSLRPDYAQSYRDLANSYRTEGLIENSWNYYMYYLKMAKNFGENGIGEIIYHEMEEIHFRRPTGFRPKESFVSKTELKDVPKDVRLVFEWDNSEAEFELEFVNPEGQAYSFIHTFEYNSKQIIDEKTRGYSSKEFMINDLSKEGWLVNVTYYGNKSDNPTYLKLSRIQNWARRGQEEKISLLKLVQKNKKFQLLRL